MNSDDLIYYYKNSGKFYGVQNFKVVHVHTWLYERIDYDYDDDIDLTIFQLAALTHYIREYIE